MNHLLRKALWGAALAATAQAQANDFTVLDELPEGLRYEAVDHGILNTIATQLPERSAVDTSFLNPDTTPVLNLNQDANVWVTGWDEGAGFKNSVFSVTYSDGAFDGLTKSSIDLNSNGNIEFSEINAVDNVQADWLFPNFSMEGKGGQLNAGATMDVQGGEILSAGTNVTFGLAANAWKGNGVADNVASYYGLDFLNPEASANGTLGTLEENSRHVAMMFSDDSQTSVIMGFEDLRRPWGDNDFNDATFTIYATPEGAFAGSEIATAPVPGLGVLGLLAFALIPVARRQNKAKAAA